MNKSLKRDMQNARISPTGKKPTKRLTEVHNLPDKPRITSDVSQGKIVSDSFDGGYSAPPGGRYIFIQYIGGSYVDSKGGRDYMTCDNTSPGLEQAFLVLDNGNNNFSFMGSNGKYVTRQNTEGTPMICNRDSVGGWEHFQFIDNGDDTFSLQGDNGKFVSSENGSAPMTCNRDSIGGWEKFTFHLLPEDYKFDWLFNTAPTAPSPTTPTQATEAQLPVPAPSPVIPASGPADVPQVDPGIAPSPAPAATTQQSVLSGGKYWWLWYVAAAFIVILYVKFYSKK